MVERGTYIQGWRRRWARDRERRRALQAEARDVAGRVAELIGTRFGACRVYLFGSLLRQDDYFCERSDIDLAVEGLPGTAYFPMLAAIAREVCSPYPLDVVRVEQCSPGLTQEIRTKGLVLYGT